MMSSLESLALVAVGKLLRENCPVLSLDALGSLPAELREVLMQEPLSPKQLKALFCANVVCINAPWCTFLNDKMLSDVAKRCPHLRTLSVGGFSFGAAPKAFSRLSSLTRLQMPRSDLTPEGLINMVLSCSQLQTLDIGGCGGVDDDVLQAALSRLPSLESLVVMGCQEITSKGFEAAAAAKLTMLQAKGCQNLNDAALVSIARRFPQLRHLDMTGIHTQSPGLCLLTQNCTQLEILKLGESEASEEAIASIAQLGSRLRKLDLSWCENAGDAAMGAIAAACGNLQTLRLRTCARITDAALLALGTSLTSVSLSGCELITDVGMDHLIQACPNVRSINVSWCSRLSMRTLIRGIHEWRNLTKYNLEGCKYINDALLEEIAAQRPGFVYLNLAWVNDASDSAIAKLARECPKIEIRNYYGDVTRGRERAASCGLDDND